jgi:asparagine synthase (glutamine-hydrolysing)
MCGFAGSVRRDGAPLADPRATARRFCDALAHRGPDGEGIWIAPDGDVLLAHRRLAIIDCCAAAAQPMTCGDGRWRLVYNGEVFNYRELRGELAAGGEPFLTASDTEVLLRLLAAEGPAGLSRVRGMFALALWDARDRRLLLARDRFGIKPLYLARAASSMAFASELGALQQAGLVDPQPAPEAVLSFLRWGSVPAPLAWNRGAEMLEAGTWLEWDAGGGERRGRFADVRCAYVTPGTPGATAADLEASVGAAVRDSVRAHLVADVPVGLFLSGGIDSGAIASCAATLGTSLRTFTVVVDDESSEASRAREVAGVFGADHAELRLAAADLVRDLPAVLARLDQPSIDGVNSFYVARAVAATGVKAVLSGAGGDELFGGYPSFRRIPAAMRARAAARGLWPMVAAGGAVVAPPRLRARWTHFAASGGSLVEAYRAQRGFFLPAEIDDVAGPELRAASADRDVSEAISRAERARLEPAGTEQPEAAVARMETRQYLQSQLLRDLDVMSMAHGLEVRVPFVDHHLLAAVWPALGSHRPMMRGKRLLHGTLELPLPASVTTHPKQGFTLPFARWMRRELQPFVRDGLRQLAVRDWLADTAPDRVWSAWTGGAVHWSRPWGLAVLGHFVSQP